jgi:hypothetical protein
MKKSVLLIALAFGVSNVFAQLSTRENDERVEKIGARPKAGDMAFVFGMPLSSDSGKAKLFDGNALKSGNVLTYKWYMEDDLVIRFGIRLMNENTSSKGTNVDSLVFFNVNGSTAWPQQSEMKMKTKKRMYEIVPGVEKHFLASNIFDAYVGADLYLGFGRDMTQTNIDYRTSGDHNYKTVKTPTTDVGLGVVTGFNVFIAHLPISLGLEYGWNAKWTFGGIDKVKEDVKAGTVSYTAEYREDNSTGSTTTGQYSKLKKREFNAETNQDVRLVLHIYFGK